MTKAWAAKKRAADAKVLTANVPFWLQVADGKIVKIPEQAKLVREMFRLAALGLGAKKIAQKINGGLAISTITKTLANRATIGEYQPSSFTAELIAGAGFSPQMEKHRQQAKLTASSPAKR